jgi:hypothetical protein
MTKVIVLRTAACIVAAATLYACGGGDSATAPPAVGNTTAKVNALLSEISAGQQAASASVSSGGGAAPSTSSSQSEDAGVCQIDLASESFKCPTRTLPNGLKMTVSFQLLDASSNPQPAFDSTTTNAIRMVTDVSGTISQPLMTPTGPVPATMTIANHDVITLSGLRTGTREHNGTGTMSNTIVPQGLPTASMTATVAFAHITFPKTMTEASYPLGGTITSVITSKTGDLPSVTISQVTTYDGTAIAKTVITLPNGSKQTCTYDMSKPPGSAPPNCSG